MRASLVQAIVIITVLASAALVADPATAAAVEDPVQRSREALEPSTLIKAPRPPRSDAEVELLNELEQAKRAGDWEAVLRIHEEYARLMNKPLEFAPPPSVDQEFITTFPSGMGGSAGEGVGGSGGLWLPDDIPVATSENDEKAPSMASDSDGHLYIAFDLDGGSNHYLFLLHSPDQGEHWYLLLGTPGAFSDPSCAVGEGPSGRYLFVAFVSYDDEVRVLRFNLDTHDYEVVFSAYNPAGVSHPSIATDSDEYDAWFAYLVYNARGVDNWVLLHTRTLDEGDTWTTPETIASYCGTPGEFYNAAASRPDVDFGSNILYAVFNNYPAPCSTDMLDIYVLVNDNFGASWDDPPIQLTTSGDTEYDPTVAAIKEEATNKTALVAYGRYYLSMDEDVRYTYTQDGGETWSSSRCIACSTPNEAAPVLTSSHYQGAFHVAFWRDRHIDYSTAFHTAPESWEREYDINEGAACSQNYPWPAIATDASQPPSREAGIAWTDIRNLTEMGYDIFFDSAGRGSSEANDGQETNTTFPFGLYCINPIGGETVLRYELPRTTQVNLGIYDVRGRLIRLLEDDCTRDAGSHQVRWDRTDDAGKPVVSGVYFSRLEAADRSATRRVVVLW
jgi:hypothetical protein